VLQNCRPPIHWHVVVQLPASFRRSSDGCLMMSTVLGFGAEGAA